MRNGNQGAATEITKFLRRNWLLYLMLLPGLVYLILFKFLPVLGNIIAFQDYSPFLGVSGSPWVGLKHFTAYLTDPHFYILLKNTFLLSVSTLVFSFPVPILFALFLNEVRSSRLRRTVQSMSFFPYFVSSAVTVGIAYSFLSPQGGLINRLLNLMGMQSIYFMSDPNWFRPLYVILNIWNQTGYMAVIYIAAMLAIDPHLYEAAAMDGANRFQCMFRITLPLISSVIALMFVVSLSTIVSIDLNKILVMYNPSIYDTADVIETYVYRQAFQSQGFPRYSFATAMGLFQSVMGIIAVVIANNIIKNRTETRLF